MCAGARRVCVWTKSGKHDAKIAAPRCHHRRKSKQNCDIWRCMSHTFLFADWFFIDKLIGTTLIENSNMPVGNLCVRGRGEAGSPVSGHPLLGFGARGHGNNSKQDRQALLKAKYCPRVSAALCTHKTHKNSRDLDLWPMTLKFNSVLEVVEIHVLANFHQAACSGSWVIVFTAFLAMVRNPKSRSCYLDLWPMTLKFSGFLGVVKMHVPAKLRQANCSGSWVICAQRRKTRTQTMLSVAAADKGDA